MSKNTNLSFLTDYITADITNGRIGINNASPTYSFDVTGIARTSTSTYLATASGNVGIGTTSPFSQGTGATSLEINGTNYGQLFVTANSAAARGTIMARSSDVYIAAITNSPLLFGTNDTLRLTIASTGAATFSSSVTATNLYSSGNSGIGTSNAQSITNGISLTIGDSATQHQPYLAFRRNSTGGYWAGISWYDQTTRKSFIEENSDFDLRFGTSNTLRMIVTSAGNVGIGASTTPVYKLEVSTAGGSERIRVGTLQNNNNTATFEAITSSTISTATSGWIRAVYGGGLALGTSSYTKTGGDSGNFANLSAEVQNTAMTITSGGSLLMAKDAAIGINTSDGSDNGYLALCGASGDGPNRGGHIYLSGNERVSDPGSVVISAGNVIGTGSFIFFRTAGTEKVRIVGSGNVIIGSTSDNGYKLQVTGSIYATGSIVANSDIILKKNILKIENALEKIKQISGYTYEFKADDSKRHAGVIAQEIQKVLPEIVNKGDDGILGVEYGNMSALLIEAIKELSAEITILKNK